MENENKSLEQPYSQKQNSYLNTVTPVSKFLAMALFVALPFIGGWVGYTYAPEKVVEVEKIVIRTEKATKQENRFIGNTEYALVRQYKKNAYIVNITPTTITLDEVDQSGWEVINKEIDSVTYDLNDTHFLTSARGPVTLETIQTDPLAVSARLNELNQPLATVEFVTYENTSGEQVDVATVVELSFSP